LELTFRPGHGQANPMNPASIAYNKDVSAHTVKWAIVDWLRDDNRKRIWQVRFFCWCSAFVFMPYLQDVIASHFKIHKDKIRAR
jgi:baculoviral IAP repeat-containing protein 6